MKIKFTSHSVERSLQRVGLTGVDLNRMITDLIKKGKIKEEKIFKDGIHHYWIKGKGIRLTFNGNILITVVKKQPKVKEQ